MKLDLLPLKQLSSISPSQYNVLKTCPYRVILSSTYKKPLLPYYPGGHLGNVIHECIRLILTNQIKSDEKFNTEWEKLVAMEENKLVKLGYESYTPLKRSVKGYTMKKFAVKSLINRTDTRVSSKGSDINFRHKHPLNSGNGLIKGKADLIIETQERVTITDFKSGRILKEDGEMKSEYEDQLKLYALLYSELEGKYPDELIIADLNRKEYQIEFTINECEDLGKDAIRAMKYINEKVDNNDRAGLANPSFENCKYCLYKPACSYHWDLDEVESSYLVNIRGVLKSIKQFENGDINATIMTGDNVRIKVMHIPGKRLNQLQNSIGLTLEVFNLKRGKHVGTYRSVRNTEFYEQ